MTHTRGNFPGHESCGKLNYRKRAETVENIGVKVLCERLAKVLNLLTTTLNRCLCNAREHVAKSGDSEENNHATTAEVQGNYPNFKQKLAEKERFLISKVSENQPMFTRCHLGAARFQMLKTRC